MAIHISQNLKATELMRSMSGAELDALPLQITLAERADLMASAELWPFILYYIYYILYDIILDILYVSDVFYST